MFQVLGGFLGDFDKASATRRTSIQAVAGDMVWGCGGWKTRHTAAKPTKTITQQPATGIAQSARRINRLGRSIAQPTHNIACPTRSIGKPDRGTRKPQGSKKQLACCVGYGSAAKPDTAGGYRGVGAGAAKDGMGSPVVHLLKRCAKRMHSFFSKFGCNLASQRTRNFTGSDFAIEGKVWIRIKWSGYQPNAHQSRFWALHWMKSRP